MLPRPTSAELWGTYRNRQSASTSRGRVHRPQPGPKSGPGEYIGRVDELVDGADVGGEPSHRLIGDEGGDRAGEAVAVGDPDGPSVVPGHPSGDRRGEAKVVVQGSDDLVGPAQVALPFPPRSGRQCPGQVRLEGVGARQV